MVCAIHLDNACHSSGDVSHTGCHQMVVKGVNQLKGEAVIYASCCGGQMLLRIRHEYLLCLASIIGIVFMLQTDVRTGQRMFNERERDKLSSIN